MDAKVQAAWIAGGVSLLTALFSIALTLYTQWRTAENNRKRDEAMLAMKAQTDADLTRLGATLSLERDEKAARRDYTYDALKRLYGEVNPLMFRLREHCEGSLWRIRRIVREDIEVDTDRHLLTSTQRLVAPLVIAQELQVHLTSVDLQLDPTMKAQYIVARELLWILHEGTTIAEADPVIDYRTADGHKEPRQHLTFAQLQRLVDEFTQSDTGGVRRPIKLSELEDRKGDKEVAEVLSRMKILFTSSSASSTPVLWRLLLAQASLMHVLIDLVDRGSANVERVLPVDIEDFAWRPGRGQSFEAQIRAVDSYLRQKLTRAGLIVTES